MRSFGVFAILGAAVVVALGTNHGCAKAGLGNRDGGTVGGDVDLSAEPMVDLAGYDLTGVDLRPDPRDLLGADLKPPICTVFPQSGCNAGEKCTLVGSGSMCATDGSKAVGAQCGPSTDDCVKGSLCTAENNSFSECRAFCAVDNDCAQAPVNGIGGKCIVTLQGNAQKLCTVPCDPTYVKRTSSGCASATNIGCEAFGLTGGGQATDCTIRGTGGDGADCATNGNADCAPGFTCVSVMVSASSTVKKCRGVCRVNTVSDCSGLSGYLCLAPSSGTPTYGFCCPTGGCQ